MERRGFLKSSAAAASAVLSTGMISNVFARSAVFTPGAGNKWPGRVVINFNKGAVTLNETSPIVVTDTVATMMNASVLRLTGKTDLGEAWKAVFPASLTAASKIAIKVPLGCAIQTMAPHWSAVKAITDGLQLMTFGTTKFPATNITIYDRRCSDNLTNYGYTTENIGSVKLVRDTLGSGYTDGANDLQYSTSLRANFLINVFRPGGHGSAYSGFTLGYKNHFGTYEPDVPHAGPNSQSYLRDINCTRAVYNKNVLSVCVGLFGAEISSGDPGSDAIDYFKYASSIDSTIQSTGTNIPPTTIIMTTDPVTAEMQAIKMMRQNVDGGKYTSADMPPYLQESAGIDAALNGALQNIGIIEESQMDIRRIINSNATPAIHTKQNLKVGHGNNVTASHISGQRSTFIEFSMAAVSTGSRVTIDIFDLHGSLVRSLSTAVSGTVNHLSWDEKDGAGKNMPAGMYVLRLSANAIRLTSRFTIQG